MATPTVKHDPIAQKNCRGQMLMWNQVIFKNKCPVRALPTEPSWAEMAGGWSHFCSMKQLQYSSASHKTSFLSLETRLSSLEMSVSSLKTRIVSRERVVTYFWAVLYWTTELLPPGWKSSPSQGLIRYSVKVKLHMSHRRSTSLAIIPGLSSTKQLRVLLHTVLLPPPPMGC